MLYLGELLFGLVVRFPATGIIAPKMFSGYFEFVQIRIPFFTRFFSLYREISEMGFFFFWSKIYGAYLEVHFVQQPC